MASNIHLVLASAAHILKFKHTPLIWNAGVPNLRVIKFFKKCNRESGSPEDQTLCIYAKITWCIYL